MEPDRDEIINFFGGFLADPDQLAKYTNNHGGQYTAEQLADDVLNCVKTVKARQTNLKDLNEAIRIARFKIRTGLESLHTAEEYLQAAYNNIEINLPGIGRAEKLINALHKVFDDLNTVLWQTKRIEELRPLYSVDLIAERQRRERESYLLGKIRACHAELIYFIYQFWGVTFACKPTRDIQNPFYKLMATITGLTIEHVQNQLYTQFKQYERKHANESN